MGFSPTGCTGTRAQRCWCARPGRSAGHCRWQRDQTLSLSTPSKLGSTMCQTRRSWPSRACPHPLHGSPSSHVTKHKTQKVRCVLNSVLEGRRRDSLRHSKLTATPRIVYSSSESTATRFTADSASSEFNGGIFLLLTTRSTRQNPPACQPWLSHEGGARHNTHSRLHSQYALTACVYLWLHHGHHQPRPPEPVRGRRDARSRLHSLSALTRTGVRCWVWS
jgi:hypothetical protein